MAVADPSNYEQQGLSGQQGLSLLQDLLEAQQSTFAVDRFAEAHSTAYSNGDAPLLEEHYRELIPLTKPKAGEQYAFEVSLDDCSGCKACVVACHNLNGLEEEETWRQVGMLHGGLSAEPFLQHITTACHHCIDPACMKGCPVLAYEKDDVTGIVRHLDDQCIGCQYCIFTCPYEVPQYSKSKGIVRKCDMCHSRLEQAEAPACVQACPNEAIRIRTISQETILLQSELDQFLPGAPAPGITLPTTVYTSGRSLPRSAIPADYFSANRQHSHLALVVMLVLTQLSVGAFCIGQLLVSSVWSNPLMLQAYRPAFALGGLLVGLIGLGAAVFHLGRPLYAYKAFLGLRTSWLSREIVAFGLFAGFATCHAATVWISTNRSDWIGTANALGLLTAMSGLLGVFCSIMIYATTHRPMWSFPWTASKFLLTSSILGIPAALLLPVFTSYWYPALQLSIVLESFGQMLCKCLIAVTITKLSLESIVFLSLCRNRFTLHKRSAMLLVGELGITTLLRYFFGMVGGILLPMLLLTNKAIVAGGSGFHPVFIGSVVLLIFALLLVGEFLERYLFFAASVFPKMPGVHQR